MKFLPLVLALLLFSACVSVKKHSQLEAQLKEAKYEILLNERAVEHQKSQALHNSRLAQKNTEQLQKNIQQQQVTILDLNNELKVFRKDSSATSKLIDERKIYKKKNADLEKRFKQLKAVDKRFFPFPTMAGRVELFNNSFDFLLVDLKQSTVEVFWKNKKGQILRNFNRTKKMSLQNKKQLLFATNGGMYTPKRLPQGLLVIGGKELHSIDKKKKGYGNFYMQPNGIFLIDKKKQAHIISTNEYKKHKKNTLYATQSGPALVLNNKLNSHFNKGSKNKYVRSGVGVLSPSKLVFVISNKPVNFYDFATLFRNYFGCADALYLDGAISKMYLPLLNRNELGGDFGPIIGVVK